MNGCFQLMIKEQETALKLVPPTNNGEPISIGELLEYLHARKIENFDRDPQRLFRLVGRAVS